MMPMRAKYSLSKQNCCSSLRCKFFYNLCKSVINASSFSTALIKNLKVIWDVCHHLMAVSVIAHCLFVTLVNRHPHMLLMWPSIIFPPKLLGFGKAPSHIMPNHEGLLLLLWGYGMLVKILEVGENTQHRSRRLGGGGSTEAYAIDEINKTINFLDYIF